MISKNSHNNDAAYFKDIANLIKEASLMEKMEKLDGKDGEIRMFYT